MKLGGKCLEKKAMKWKMNLSKVGDWKNLRKILAALFVLLILVLLMWSWKKDFRLKDQEWGLRPFRLGIYYSIELKSFNPVGQTFNATLGVDRGVLPLKMYLPGMIHYGPLVYDDFTVPYALGIPFFSQKLVAQSGPFQTVKPPPKEISITAIGDPENYPFDKYFILGAAKCPAYFMERNTKKYLENQESGESVGIINSINGLFIRKPTKKEINQIKIRFSFGRPISPIEDKHLKEINNRKDTFAIMIVRPYYLRFMTVVLGVFALAVAWYIGFKQPLNNIAISMPGFVIAVWGIRSILLSDTKVFLAYFDYVALILYLLLVVGITYRLILGEKK